MLVIEQKQEELCQYSEDKISICSSVMVLENIARVSRKEWDKMWLKKLHFMFYFKNINFECTSKIGGNFENSEFYKLVWKVKWK